MKGRPTEQSGSTGYSSTEDFEEPTPPSERTETYLSSRKLGVPAREVDEANIILIAHPENARLGSRFRLDRGSSLDVGRSSSASISFPEIPSISRHHARLAYKGNRITIQDLDSTNGTYVNDRLIEGESALRSGDRFQVGALYFKFLHEQDVEAAYYETIHQLAIRDGLTGIFNKRKFDEEIAREFSRASRHRRPLVLILFDIDRFKSVNDTYGHLCGDHVLGGIAGLVEKLLRPEQVFARVGGEEFAILSPEINTTGARLLAEKLRRRIAASEWHYAGVDLKVTCSFGIAEVLPSHESSEELFALADLNLYRAKELGRDRVVVAREVTE